MALRSALWLPSTSYAPEDDRLGMSALWLPSGSNTNLLQVRSGVVPRPANASARQPLQVYAAAGLTASVNAGQLVYAGANNATQGAYIVTNDAAATVTFQTADPTNPRIDVVYVLVQDTSEGDPANNTQLLVQKGTAAPTPVAPAIPAGAFPLANVQIRAATTSVLDTDITDRRVSTTTLGGELVCTSTTRPANPYLGQRIYTTDNDFHEWWDGGNWRIAQGQKVWAKTWPTSTTIYFVQSAAAATTSTVYTTPNINVEPNQAYEIEWLFYVHNGGASNGNGDSYLQVATNGSGTYTQKCRSGWIFTSAAAASWALGRKYIWKAGSSDLSAAFRFQVYYQGGSYDVLSDVNYEAFVSITATGKLSSQIQ